MYRYRFPNNRPILETDQKISPEDLDELIEDFGVPTVEEVPGDLTENFLKGQKD